MNPQEGKDRWGIACVAKWSLTGQSKHQRSSLVLFCTFHVLIYMGKLQFHTGWTQFGIEENDRLTSESVTPLNGSMTQRTLRASRRLTCARTVEFSTALAPVRLRFCMITSFTGDYGGVKQLLEALWQNCQRICDNQQRNLWTIPEDCKPPPEPAWTSFLWKCDLFKNAVITCLGYQRSIAWTTCAWFCQRNSSTWKQ